MVTVLKFHSILETENKFNKNFTKTLSIDLKLYHVDLIVQNIISLVE